MIAQLADIVSVAGQALFAAFVVFLRIGAAMAVLPAFGEQAIPARVRLGLAVAFTLVVAPAVAQHLADLMRQGRILAPYLLAEPLIGLIFGLMLRMFVVALQIAGTIAAQATSLSQLFGGSTGEPQPAIGHLLVMGGLALAVMAGLHVDLARALIGSYDILLPGRLPAAEDVRGWGLQGVASSFSLAFSLSAPFVVAGLIYNVALGAINRAMPQLMVAFVGAPALTAGGLVFLAIAVPSALTIWHGALTEYIAAPFGPVR